MQTVAGSTKRGAGRIATTATPSAIEQPKTDIDEPIWLTSLIKSEIPISDEDGSANGKSQSESESLTSSSSDAPSRTSKKRWRKPANVREFAAQANAVTTLILNGDIDPEAARLYSSIARTVAQSMSIEVTRARFLKERPDLEFGDEVWEDE